MHYDREHPKSFLADCMFGVSLDRDLGQEVSELVQMIADGREVSIHGSMLPAGVSLQENIIVAHKIERASIAFRAWASLIHDMYFFRRGLSNGSEIRISDETKLTPTSYCFLHVLLSLLGPNIDLHFSCRSSESTEQLFQTIQEQSKSAVDSLESARKYNIRLFGMDQFGRFPYLKLIVTKLWPSVRWSGHINMLVDSTSTCSWAGMTSRRQLERFDLFDRADCGRLPGLDYLQKPIVMIGSPSNTGQALHHFARAIRSVCLYPSSELCLDRESLIRATQSISDGQTSLEDAIGVMSNLSVAQISNPVLARMLIEDLGLSRYLPYYDPQTRLPIRQMVDILSEELHLPVQAEACVTPRNDFASNLDGSKDQLKTFQIRRLSTIINTVFRNCPFTLEQLSESWILPRNQGHLLW